MIYGKDSINCSTQGQYYGKAKNKKAEFVLWMGPILDALRELGDSGSPKEVSDLIAKNLNIPDEKKEELTDSGVPRFHNQVCWARQYLVWEGFLSSAKRGLWTLTEKGRTGHVTESQGRDIFRKWVEIHAAARETKKMRKNNQTSLKFKMMISRQIAMTPHIVENY